MVAERKAAALKQQRSVETRDALLVGAARVFARLPYAEARHRDIASEAGVSEGSLYFHFGTKAEIANAVLAAEYERMTAVLADIEKGSDRALDKILLLMTRLGDLISRDEIVQGGIRLSGQPSGDYLESARDPYFEWEHFGRILIQRGIDDGSIRPDVDVAGSAEYINALFVGAQVLSGLEDSWASLPRRIGALIPLVTRALSS
ncbi:MAG TPA: TetR/AcrR family transcriptional regulator [Microbacterium sp.]|jgi:AcrR family transcriptional regulator|uniref:TetR/AcrR family transcriptional regulator n=1 Tax=Microbacterium sp. TaxID=51671 RepID=UPI002B4A9E56|nr:TetR/AcrR family transcriptional regulator [Microbacterium sp.]HKT56294.1 TetR/AcrR family transcriptional regulator [Microbacterium sp.]